MAGNAIGFALDLAGVILPFALTSTPSTPPEAKTNVQIILGSGEDTKDAGGACPHIALWDDDGKRIGQWHPKKKCNIRQGDVKNIVIEHTQTTPKNSQANPYYIMVSQSSDDAICVASIAVAGSKISGSFFGDTGYMCGQSWFPSENRIGDDYTNPRCVWLDANHDFGINARALSFHLNDMMPNEAKMAQYTNNRDTLCRSTPRFSFWGNLLPDGVPPFFNPPLEYKDGNGEDMDLAKVIDDPNDPYDKSVYVNQAEKAKHRRETPRTRRTNVRGANHNPDHLIVSEKEYTSCREVCNSKTSYGWDIACPKQGLFCDMEHKQLYQLCDENLTSNCFDLEQKTLVPGIHIRDLGIQGMRFRRSYNTTSYWRAT